MPSLNKIILFDGVCNFCNYWVNFIIKRDRKNIFKFASLQSEAGIKLLEKFSINKAGMDSVILIENVPPQLDPSKAGEKYFVKSSAALKIAKELTPFLKLFYFLIIIPAPVRDLVYDLVAKNRYKIFGKRNACLIPTEEEKSKFIF